jgi:hypothetical protein
MMKKLIIAIFSVLMLTIYSNSFSQITGSCNAKGTVLTPISIISTTDLNFGTTLLPGISVSIDKTSGSAGKFSLSGYANKQISISFILPSSLINGSYTMPITFSSSDAAYKITSGSYTAFNPAVSVNANLGTDGKMDVVLGGNIIPAHNQPAGLYTAPVQINLFYTGS